MILSEAVAKRVRGILNEKNMTQYRLEQNAGVNHSTMKAFLNGRYKKLQFNNCGFNYSQFWNDCCRVF